MSVLGLLGAALGVVTEGLKLANTKESRKYIDRISDLRLSILSEKKRGYDADDVLLENLYKELEVALEAAGNEIKLALPQS